MKLRLAALTCLLVSGLAAENWPHWRGPNHNGTSNEKNLPTSWSTTENVAWKVAMPDISGSTPIVWGDHIFLNVADSGSLWLWCLNRSDGSPRWKQKIGEGDHRVRKGNLSSPSPVTDGKTVWILTGAGHLHAYDFAGKQIWARNLMDDYGRWGLNHGYGSSPLLFEGGLYVQVLQGMHTDDPSYVLRVDPATGKTVWRIERPTDAIRESPDAYTTPTIVRVSGTPQLVVSGGDYVTGHDLASGKELWRAGGMNPYRDPSYRVVASSLVVGGLIVVPARVNPVQVFRSGGAGDISKSHLVWKTTHGPDVPTPVSDGKLLYLVSDGGILWVYDLQTGQEVYGGRRMKPATYTSSPVLADGKIYAGNEDGLVVVVKAGSEFQVLAENNLDDYLLSSPAISDGQIFVRTRAWLYCIGKRSGG